MNVLSDEQIIAKHDPSCRMRARIELRIVKLLIETLRKSGFKIYESETKDSIHYNDQELLTLLFDLDEAYLNCLQLHDRNGWIRLIFGNDGFDVISDYTTNLETVIAPINDLADKIANGDMSITF